MGFCLAARSAITPPVKQALRGNVMLVTGASSGIGEAIAREAVAQGARVVLGARRLERLEQLARELGADRAIPVRCDVTSKQDLDQAVRAARAFGPLDVVIANAGFGVAGSVLELQTDDYLRQFDTNVLGVVRTIQAAAEDLKLTRGRIGVIGSVNGYLSIPGHSAYCMSKHAVRSLCASLRHELGPLGVSTTHLTVGFVESDFRRVDGRNQYHPERSDPVPHWLQLPAKRAAAQILSAVHSRSEERIVTAHAKLAVALVRHAPRLTSAAMGLSGGLIRRWSPNGATNPNGEKN